MLVWRIILVRLARHELKRGFIDVHLEAIVVRPNFRAVLFVFGLAETGVGITEPNWFRLSLVHEVVCDVFEAVVNISVVEAL